MSLETALDKLADAILAHAAAIKLAATHSVTIDCSVDSSAAVAALKEVTGSSDAGKSDKKPAGKTEAKSEDKSAAKGPIYWADSANEFFGKVDTEAEYKAKKAKSETVFKITESIYEKKLADLKAKNEAKEAAKKAEAAAEAEAAAAEAEVDDDPTAGMDDEPTDAPVEDHVPTKEEYTAGWQRFLKIDDEALRTKRLKWTKGLLTHFGAPKATEIDEEHWPLVYRLVAAGTDGDLPDLDSELNV